MFSLGISLPLVNAEICKDTSKPYNNTSPSTSLLYSVGCHSGLNVVAGAINSTAPAFYSADFPQAVLKQGGNWIGNTGYGYGDSDTIGYSERLATLFTKQIGRDVPGTKGYAGAPIGIRRMQFHCNACGKRFTGHPRLPM